MYRLRRISYFALISFMVIFFTLKAAPAAAQNKISITPLLILNTKLENNYFKTPVKEEEVTTFLVRPGMEATFKTEKSHASLYYTLDSYTYSGLEQDLDFIGHDFRFDAGTRTISEKLQLKFKDTYKRARYTHELDYLTNSVSRDEFGINRFMPYVLYQLGNASIGLEYENVMINYASDAVLGEDSDQICNYTY